MMPKSKTATIPLAVSKTVPLQQLRAGDAINARRTGRDTALDELKASILAHGVVQSLRVRLVGESHYEVIAGNRRLLALQGLEHEGKIPHDFEVPVIVSVIDDAAAHELSVVENVERVPVSPVDEFKAYGRLHDEGMAPDDIAARFGVPARRVQQRLKLAALHPVVLSALETGKIGLEAAQLFTLAAPERQAEKFEALSKSQSWALQSGYAWQLRGMLTEEHIKPDSDLAKFIGEEAYLAAGGLIQADLFEDRQYWISRDIADELVERMWAERVDRWLDEGWAWVKPESDVPDWYQRVRFQPSEVELGADDAARLAAIEAEMEDYDTDNGLAPDEEAQWLALEAEADSLRDKMTSYSAEDRARSGVIYWPTSGRVEFGFGEPRAGGSVASGAAEKKATLSPEDPAAVGPTVSETLSAVLSDALRTEVAADPDLALPLLAAFMAVGQGGGSLPAHLSVGHATDPSRDGKQGIAEAFRYFDEMPDEELLAAIARMLANTIDVRDSFLHPKFQYSSNTAAGRQKLVREIVEVVEPRDFPEFDAAAYFSGVKKPLIAAAFKEITGDAIKDGKKADMAATTAKLAVERGWLPIALRNATYEGPGAVQDEQQLEAAE
jgi:ParB family chromosome partitioning protein